jgi:uncharacterized protein (TIGR00255 family)
MIKSMTAYARAETHDHKGQQWLWELRSVNHRYLEQTYKLPDQFRPHEFDCRALLSKRLNRGKVEIQLKPIIKSGNASNSDSNKTQGLYLNHKLLEKLLYTGNELAAHYQSAPLTTAEILQWPGITDNSDSDEQDFENQNKWLLSALNKAIDDFIVSRQTEGGKIAKMLLSRCDDISAILEKITPRCQQILAKKQQKLIERIAELGAELNQERLEQEVALLAQKLDISEELDRLAAHLTEVKDILQRDDAVGRRLDFMLQELNREANTLGSKSNDQETTKAAVDIKVLLEQMREQIQNIE